MYLSFIERAILNSIQEEIPLEPRPFEILSKRLGMEEDELLNKIKRLKCKGVIRSFVASVNHERLGFASSLIALKVSPKRLKSITRAIVSYPEVTHCFMRHGEYNLWVAFLYKKDRLKKFLEKISPQIGQKNILNLKTLRRFKLNTILKI